MAFITLEKELILPPFDKILSSCTAKRLLKLAPKFVEQGNLKSVKVANLTVEEAKGAAEMMFVGSALPVLPIVEWDDKLIGDGKLLYSLISRFSSQTYSTVDSKVKSTSTLLLPHTMFFISSEYFAVVKRIWFFSSKINEQNENMFYRNSWRTNNGPIRSAMGGHGSWSRNCQATSTLCVEKFR